MTVLEIIGGVALILCSIAIVVFVSVQSEKSDGLASAILGGGDSSNIYKGKAKSNEEKLATLTKYLGIGFFALAMLANIFVLIAN